MSFYAVVDDFRTGMPQTVLVGGLRPRGLSCHTSEGAEGEAGALGTIQFLIDRPDRNASYSEMWYAKGDGFEARRIVRPDRASHSMNPAQPPWSPDARVRRILGDRWFDPNAVSYSVSIAGTTAGTVPNLVNDAGFMAGARRRTTELLAQFAASLAPDPLFNHGEGQADRSDWGLLMRPAILAPGGDMPVLLKVVREKWITKFSANGSAGYFTTDGPGTGERKWFTAAETVESYAETTDGRYRALSYANGTETLWMERGQLLPIPGSRLPPTGFGLVTPDCTALANAAKQATASKAEAQVQAWIATRPTVVP